MAELLFTSSFEEELYSTIDNVVLHQPILWSGPWFCFCSGVFVPRGKIDHVLCMGLHSPLKVINIVIVVILEQMSMEAGLDSRAFLLHSGHLASGAWGEGVVAVRAGREVSRRGLRCRPQEQWYLASKFPLWQYPSHITKPSAKS